MSLQLIQKYHSQVERLYRFGGSDNETVLRKPFHDLLDSYAQSKNLMLVPEIEVRVKGGRRVVPDGILKDALRQDWGYWEAKDSKDRFEIEIEKKFAKGYPDTNILFEDTKLAILFQDGKEAIRAKLKEYDALDEILTQFVSYEPPEVINFHRAIKQFNADIPALAIELRNIIEEQFNANEKFRKGLSAFLEICQKAINPRVTPLDVREMIIQHILTEDVFMTVFDEIQFHRENNIAHKLHDVVDTFYQGATQRSIRARIAPYYETVNARASNIYNHLEKQKFLKALYENFYRSYNPKAADRLGVIYTPDEIVRFMIHATDHLVSKHFGKTLGDSGVEILDPATGTGTFITELIEYLPEEQLKHKYQNEIHCNELGILPYYIANLNIEYTYRQKIGEYLSFENICFVDTLDNMGFEKCYNHQLDFFAIGDDNARRIKRQNERHISVIIGNPPYNANQLNENENNKNREYPEIDKRIKETYIKHSTAQKTKAYDMYARFYRWASDRLTQNGILAFVTNSSFLDSRTFDGFRKVVADEFSHIYIVDLGGNVRKNQKLSGTTHNVFGIQVGVAITFLIRSKANKEQCKIFYARRPEMERARDKLEFLRNTYFDKVEFVSIRPDKNHNWLNLTENDWSDFIPVASKEAKETKVMSQAQAIFRFHSLGVSTNRDEWVFDLGKDSLKRKIEFLIKNYNLQSDISSSKKLSDINDSLEYSIKWSDSLKRKMMQGEKLKFDKNLIVNLHYRPYFKVMYYSEKSLSDRLTENHFELFGSNLKKENKIIAVNVSTRPFNVLSSSSVVDLHVTGDSQCFPLFRYTNAGERIENITD